MKLRLLALAPLLAAGLALVPPSPSDAAASARPTCDVYSDGGHYKHGAFRVAHDVLAQYRTYSFAPGYRRTVTKQVSKVSEYQAGFKVGGSLNTKVGNSWIGKAEVELHADFEASGRWSTTKTTTVTDTVVNNSRHNATFVFYRGSASKLTAPTYVSSCRNDDGGNPRLGHLYWVRSGRFASFTPPSEGALRCGAGTANVNSVGRKALRVGCR